MLDPVDRRAIQEGSAVKRAFNKKYPKKPKPSRGHGKDKHPGNR